MSTNGTQTAAQSYSSTINPLRFFPNINFTGSPSYGEINYSLQSNNTLELNNTSHLLDDTLIRYVGVDKYETWLASTKKTTNTVKDFWDYFYINNQLCRSIMQESGVFDYYDMESIFALRENE